MAALFERGLACQALRWYPQALDDFSEVVRLRPKGVPGPGSLVGMALVEGVRFTEGSIEVDLKGKGKAQRSFLGVAFAVADGKTFEAVYFRPFNFLANDAKLSKKERAELMAQLEKASERKDKGDA